MGTEPAPYDKECVSTAYVYPPSVSMRPVLTHFRALVLGGLTAGAAGHVLAAGPDAAALEFFEKKVRPVLVERCFECHSTTAKVKGGLSLDTREAIFTGGDSGPALVAGNPDKSLLIEAIGYKNQDMQMPPKKQLPAAEMEALVQWVKMGAPDPRTGAATAKAATGMDLQTGRGFWSFKPLAAPATPSVKNTAWVKTPIDAFLLSQLEAKGVSPAPPADKRTLIRRATQDLTGLPATPEEVEAFLKDESTEAFSKVIERLLNSPAYGERWGRHWLDVARYADSNGMDENVAFGHAWRYRDYVVRAFNNDKPYDQFLIEQVAGDLLPAQDTADRKEALAATGFLALGAKVLAEPDVQKFKYDTIDEQLDTLGKAFVGMTFGCARCHDHKFDPVTQADYFALAAIFQSTRSIADEKLGAIKFWYEHAQATPEQLAAKKAHEAKAAEKRKVVTAFSTKARAELKAELHGNAAEYLTAAAQLPDDPDFADVEKLAKASKLRPRYLLTCRQYLTRKSDHPFFAEWRTSTTAKKPAEVRTHYAPLFAAALKIDPKAKDAPKPAAEVPEARAALDDLAGFLAIPDKDADAFDAETLAKVTVMMDDLMSVEDATPDPPAFMGVAESTVTRTMPIHIRGSYLTLGKEVERGFPEVMRTSFNKPVFPNKQSGRLELARWLASSDHPLTARVMVNRLWRWHFGKGIVTSTDNFGVLGDKPSHPELLDWLARVFIENGWSVKDMHRLIMKSSAYQMASSHPSSGTASSAPDPAMLDPENRLLWHFNIQRLEAEQIRDSLLHVSGTLSQEIGGKTIPLRNREFVFNHTSRDHTTYETPRRALYLPIIRNHLYDMLEQFDYPDPTMPTGSRNATVVAPQALIMLNAPVVLDASANLSKRIAQDTKGGTIEARLQRVYALAYNREPTLREIDRAKHFIQDSPNQEEAWNLLCQSLLAANEFMYLR
ncbi:hypothetical protein BGE01nite_45450 [Brevifollis gellanilyticus]|uniref:Cytochrome c domain-containing protein n=2 Tax=Brevifollis gellanilyticus TaxID=748831 RepID=A0A512MEU0_9BACT|nr:hypothetical protein BGE01nite_45450 [Brevifollis gellanilyticus]